MTAARRPAVVVFCKAPVPGRMKTRLTPGYPPEHAAALGAAMLLDVAAALEGTDMHLSAAAARPEDRGAISALLPARYEVTVQTDGDLGQRMGHEIRTGLANGHAAVAVVGSDCPEITASLVEDAFAALADADAVVSPSGDGGYSLIAATSDIAPLLKGIPWSTERVVQQTRAAAAGAGLRLTELPALHDVDRAEDVARVTGDPLRPSASAARTRAVATSLARREENWHSRVESANRPSLY